MHSLKKVLQGDVLAAAKLVRGLEDNTPEAVADMKNLYRHTGKAYIVGVSGAPGAGKSTLLANLIGAFRKNKFTVGVVAIDPTSPLSGGALLGDRLRMQKHGGDKDVFIRSLASRGWKGGLSRAATNAVRVMDAMGKDIIFVEAVGSGQGETDFCRLADTSILVLVPGMGDDIQTIKAGIMEVADIFVVNKSDRHGATAFKTSIETMLDMSPGGTGWRPPVILTEATDDRGTGKLVKELLRHKAFLVKSGRIAELRRRRAELELTTAVENNLREHMEKLDDNSLSKLIIDLVERNTDPVTAAEQVIKLTTDRNKLEDNRQRINSLPTFGKLTQAQQKAMGEIASNARQSLNPDKRQKRKGITVIFSGAEDDTKWAAAGMLARGLNLNLYKIDITRIIGKYAGETEKSLRKLLTQAESLETILFFDEGDALFGKRSEIKDSHDNYANQETDYLLKLIEDYQGLVIVSSNSAEGIDASFPRRLRFIVDFPFPDVIPPKKRFKVVKPNASRGNLAE